MILNYDYWVKNNKLTNYDDYLTLADRPHFPVVAIAFYGQVAMYVLAESLGISNPDQWINELKSQAVQQAQMTPSTDQPQPETVTVSSPSASTVVVSGGGCCGGGRAR